MNIHSKKAQFAINQYKAGALPQGRTEKLNVAGENLLDRYESLRDRAVADDNSALDDDPTDGIVKYNGGDFQNYTFTVADQVMTTSVELSGYAAKEEFEFSDEGIRILRAHHDVVGSGGSKGGLSVDQISRDGSQLTRESWWMDVNPLMTDLLTPNFKSQ